MPLLFDDDYRVLQEMGLLYTEDESSRFFIFRNYRLPSGVYTVSECDVLVEIPRNYNHQGNDMFWTNPRLRRADGVAIPQTLDEGHGANKTHEGHEFCRWSRHWNPGTSGAWKPGKDNIMTIQRRIEWALNHPEAKI